MGFMRQSAALGLCVIALFVLSNKRPYLSVLLIGLASFIHISSIMLLPVYIYSLKKSKKISFVIVASIIGGIIAVLSSDGIAMRVQRYLIDNSFYSSGAIIRCSFSFVTVILYLLFKRSWDAKYKNMRQMETFSVFVTILFIMSFGYSTVADRFMIYASIFQILVFVRLPDILNISYGRLSVGLVIVIYGLFYYSWFKLSAYSAYWIPYKNILF